ncbi:MAG: GNAT family N-acetyltransferase [Roseburia sp.]|nr:GNAT family N-acetyltransferase [Roseburia sp.]
MEIIDLSQRQIERLENALERYDISHISHKPNGRVSIGISSDGKLVGGLDACMTAFKILYCSTVFVDEKYRRKGYGRLLIEEMERRAKALGANTVRLDTFDFQGKDFYIAMGYRVVGCYRNDEDNYSEYFFMKRI